MVYQESTQPKQKIPKRVVTRHTVLIEDWETKEQCFERVKKQFNVTDEQLKSGSVIINLIE